MAQKTGPFRFETPAGKSRYTKLFACISEEEDGYVVQVRLSNEKKPENSAWGEEMVDSFERASELVAALAGDVSLEHAHQVETDLEARIREAVPEVREVVARATT